MLRGATPRAKLEKAVEVRKKDIVKLTELSQAKRIVQLKQQNNKYLLERAYA